VDGVPVPGLEWAASPSPRGGWRAVVVALDGGRLAGLSAALARGDTWFLAALFVSSEYQGRRVGRELLDRSWAGDYRRRMTTTALQPASTGMYSRRGLIPTTPILTLSGAPRCGPPDGLEAVLPEPAALATLDRGAYGFERAAEHRFWDPRAAQASLWLLAGEPIVYSYSYVDGQG
jgi:GNAT superfamily N-acetyltransferase